jgi:hypothetical protein
MYYEFALAIVLRRGVLGRESDACWPKLSTFNPRESWLEQLEASCCCLSAILAIASPFRPSLTHILVRQAANMAEGMFYNVTAGYIEGIVRGYRNNLLTGQNYGNLTQCETIDGMQAHTLALLRSAYINMLTIYQT